MAIIKPEQLSSGSYSISGSFSGSFQGDGSQLSGIAASKWSGSNPITRDSNVEITGSLNVTGGITASLFGTASWAENASTASYVTSLYQDVLISGSLTVTGSVNITGSTTQIGNNTLLGNTTLSGSIIISGSTNEPSVQIYGNTSHDGYVRFNPVSTNIDNSISASYIYVSGSTNDLYFSQNGEGYSNTTRLRWLEGNIYTGILTGGVVSGSVGSTTFNVSSGSGIIVTLNATTASIEPYPTIKYVTWPSFNNITPTYLNTQDTTWLGIDSDGNLIQQANSFINGQFDDNLQIGSVIHPNLSTISLFKTFTITSYGIAQQTYEFIRSFGAIKVSGHTITPSGSSLSINRSSGVAYALGRNYINDANKPSLVSDASFNAPNIFRYYKSGSVFVTSTGTTTINPTQYNTPNTATGLSSTPGGQYTIQRLFYFPNQTNTIGVYYGRTTYNSISTALSNLPYETFEENNNTLTQAIFVAYLIVKGGTTNLSNTSDAQFIQAGTFRNTTSGGGGATSISLNDLSDVVISSVQQGDLLVYDGVDWKNLKQLTGSYGITGSLQATSFTGSLLGTASYATQALSSSFAQTASFAQSGNGIFSGSFSGSFVGDGSQLIGVEAFPFTGSAEITGSLNVIGTSQTSQLGVGASPSGSTKLDVRAQGALSTDVVFRVRNSADTLNTFQSTGDGKTRMQGSIYYAEFDPATGIFVGNNFGNMINLNGVLQGTSWFNAGADGKLAVGRTGASYRFHVNSSTTNFNTPACFNVADSQLTGTVGIAFTNTWTGDVFGNVGGVLNMKHTHLGGNGALQNCQFDFNLNYNNSAPTTRASITGRSNVLIGTPTENIADSHTIYIPNGTAPTASITDGFKQYSADIVAGNAAPHFLTENGSIIKLYQQSAVTSSQGLADVLTNVGLLATGSSIATAFERLSDFQSPYHYSGNATLGTSTSSTGWIINRIDFTTPGSPITLQGTGSWDNRTSLIYS